MVMYLGRVVEAGPVESIYRHPRHPYTRALFASKPTLDPDRRTTEMPLTGDPPNPINPPSGCRFRTRCGFAQPRCADRSFRRWPRPFEGDTDPTHAVACIIPEAQVRHGGAPWLTEPRPARVEDLTVRFTRRNTDVAAVNGVDFSLQAGETLTILGESGSGKSVSLKALMGLLPALCQRVRARSG